MAQTARPDEVDLDADVELPPEQWDAWQVFLGCEHNWRVLVGMSAVHYDGIDTTSMRSVMEMLGIKPRRQRDVFWMVRVLESEARKFLNKR